MAKKKQLKKKTSGVKAKKSPAKKKAVAKKPAKVLAKKAAPVKAAKVKAKAAPKAKAKAAAAPKTSKIKAAAQKVLGKVAKALKPTPEPKAPKAAKAPKEKVTKTKASAVETVEEIEINPLDAQAMLEEIVPEEIILTDAEGRRYCRTRDCDQLSLVEGYCRYHYLLFWKKIQVRKKILEEGKLIRYIEELTSRYPDKFLEMLRKDLRSEKDFLAAIQELEIDESAEDGDFEDEAQNYIEEVRGMAEPGARTEDDF